MGSCPEGRLRDRGGGVVRTRRTLEGNAEPMGVAGRTLTDVWGDRAEGSGFEIPEVIELVEDVDDALEW